MSQVIQYTNDVFVQRQTYTMEGVEHFLDSYPKGVSWSTAEIFFDQQEQEQVQQQEQVQEQTDDWNVVAKVNKKVQKVQKNKICDREIRCEDCLNYFLFSVGQQLFFQERSLENPKRCKECSNKKKMNKNRRN